MIKICKICDNVFIKTRNTKTCSFACSYKNQLLNGRAKSLALMQERMCVICNSAIPVTARKHKISCSINCASKKWRQDHPNYFKQRYINKKLKKDK